MRVLSTVKVITMQSTSTPFSTILCIAAEFDICQSTCTGASSLVVCSNSPERLSDVAGFISRRADELPDVGPTSEETSQEQRDGFQPPNRYYYQGRCVENLAKMEAEIVRVFDSAPERKLNGVVIRKRGLRIRLSRSSFGSRACSLRRKFRQAGLKLAFRSAKGYRRMIVGLLEDESDHRR